MSKHYDTQIRLKSEVIGVCVRVVSEATSVRKTQKWMLEEFWRLAGANMKRLTAANRQYCLGYLEACSPSSRLWTNFEFKYFLDGKWQTAYLRNADTNKRIATDRGIPRGFFWKGTDDVWFLDTSL